MGMYMDMCTCACKFRDPLRPEEGVRSPKVGVPDSHELLVWC